MGFDPIGFVEHCYDLDPDASDWLSRAAALAHPSLDRGYGTAAVIYDVRQEPLRVLAMGAHACPYDMHDVTERAAELTTIDLALHVMGEDGAGAVVGSERARDLPVDLQPTAFYAALGTEVPIRDQITVGAFWDGGHFAMLGAHAADTTFIDATEAARWARIAWHYAAGWRLRRRLGAAEAVMRPDGTVLHAEGSARQRDARGRLRAAVRQVDRARTRAVRRTDEALDLWGGLVSGRWSLVDRFESDGRRYVVAHANPPRGLDPRGLSERERACAALAAQGRSNADIAYGLGISESTVATHVASAMRKLGLRSRTELLQVMLAAANAHMTREGLAAGSVPAPSFPASLTEAETEVAQLVADGLSDESIAARRGTSRRTVANQLRSVYQKMGVHSRAGLVDAALRPSREASSAGVRGSE